MSRLLVLITILSGFFAVWSPSTAIGLDETYEWEMYKRGIDQFEAGQYKEAAASFREARPSWTDAVAS